MLTGKLASRVVFVDTAALRDAQVVAYKAAQADNLTGLVYWDVLQARIVVVPVVGDWETVYFKAAVHTIHVAQYDRVHIYVRGTERGWLSGQC